MALDDLLRDESYREELAKQSYYAERADEAAKEAEHELGDYAYYVIAWEDISPDAQRPYRSAVATTCENIAALELA